MDQDRILITPEISLAFTQVAHTSRLSHRMMKMCGDPRPGSDFSQVNDLYPFEKVSDRARHYVDAALEHLLMWADFAAPLKFHPEQVTNFTMRPTHALARAALESAAQAVWLMDTSEPLECVQRHLRLIRWDLAEHRKSKLDEDDKKKVKARDATLLTRVADVFIEDQIQPPNGYLWVLQQACRPEDLDLDASHVERLWRAASGAAHGMYWTNLELTHVIQGEEYEPGQFRAFTIPDAQAMVDVLQASQTMSTYAVLKYLTRLGDDPGRSIAKAREWLAQEIPLKPGANPDARQRLAAGLDPNGEI